MLRTIHIQCYTSSVKEFCIFAFIDENFWKFLNSIQYWKCVHKCISGKNVKVTWVLFILENLHKPSFAEATNIFNGASIWFDQDFLMSNKLVFWPSISIQNFSCDCCICSKLITSLYLCHSMKLHMEVFFALDAYSSRKNNLFFIHYSR